MFGRHLIAARPSGRTGPILPHALSYAINLPERTLAIAALSDHARV